jgi:aconitate hydratase
MLAGKQKVAVPTTVHCDHLIQAAVGAQEDLQQAILQNDEVYQFLKSAANKYNMGFWKPGAGIIHQVVLENYAVPGMLMIGTDSHTPNAGGLGMVAIGVGGADAVDAMVGQAWKVSMPKLIGVHLKGKLNGWTAPKDIILKVAELLTVKGGTGHIVEYFGEGTETISATGKATITNMGAEIGATTSLFPYDKKSADYLGATRREFVAEQANQQDLRADKEVEENPEDYFDQVLTIDLNQLKPYVNGPFSPDYARPISKLGEEAKKNDWPIELTYGLIGSCTNSSYEDMERAASIAEQAAQHGLVAKSGFMVTPGSEQIHQTIKRDGQMASFQKIGGVVLANACGPCIGQWKREDMKEGEKNSIITSYNRNFKKRNDGNPHTHGFVASPEIVTALVLAGRLDFNPLTDALETPEGTTFTLKLPVGKELPETSFVFDTTGYEQPTGEGEVVVNPKSERLALLEPFTSWKENDFENLFVLVKAKGKCTTDHISPAGKWLKYRGHLDNISNNMYSGAVNDFRDEVGKGKNQLSGEIQEYSTIARAYKAAGRGWLVVGDSNYGEGSSREHAAMEPRHLGCRVVVAKSFARIAETNLKKQGVLPLHFIHEEDFQKILEDDQVTVDNIDLVVGQEIHLIITHADESLENIPTTHTLTEEQIAWFNSGSALEWMRKNNQ